MAVKRSRTNATKVSSKTRTRAKAKSAAKTVAVAVEQAENGDEFEMFRKAIAREMAKSSEKVALSLVNASKKGDTRCTKLVCDLLKERADKAGGQKDAALASVALEIAAEPEWLDEQQK